MLLFEQKMPIRGKIGPTIKDLLIQKFNPDRGIFNPYLSIKETIVTADKIILGKGINLSQFNYLYSSKEIKSYFKGTRALTEYPGLAEVFEKRGFDMSLYYQVKNDVNYTREKFLSNMFTAVTHFTNRNNYLSGCNIHQNELNYALACVYREIFLGIKPIFNFPELETIFLSINFRASVGLPNPFLKKRDIMIELHRWLSRFYRCEIKLSEIFKYPSVIFLRSQIRTSGLKQRLVFAVHALQQSLESFYYYYFISGVPKGSALALGLTQLEISSLVSKFENKYTYSIDYSKWDFNKQPILSVIAFEILQFYLPLNIYLRKVLNTLRDLYLKLPCFHPNIELQRRYLGTTSGSGFTSLDNSLCNWILVHIVLYRYCNKVNLNINTLNPLIHVCGDDLLLGTDVPIDSDLLFSIIKEDFGIQARLEMECAHPGNNTCFFLGSKWVNNEPYRDESTLVASVCFGSGNFPKMSLEELMQSRFFEIFGNSADTLKQFRRLKMPLIPRFFFFKELYIPVIQKGLSRRTDLIEGMNPKDFGNPRGFWYNRYLNTYAIAHMWKER